MREDLVESKAIPCLELYWMNSLRLVWLLVVYQPRGPPIAWMPVPSQETFPRVGSGSGAVEAAESENVSRSERGSTLERTVGTRTRRKSFMLEIMLILGGGDLIDLRRWRLMWEMAIGLEEMVMLTD